MLSINRSRPSGWLWLALMLTSTVLLLLLLAPPLSASRGARWTSAGQNLSNTRHQENEKDISPANVHQLAPAWIFNTTGDVSATPAVVGGALYVPDWGGNLYKLDAKTGALIWSRSIASYTGVAGSLSRTTPAIAGKRLVIGTRWDTVGLEQAAYLLGIDIETGALLWKTQLDDHPAAIITQSPVIHEGRVYVGVSSDEELLSSSLGYPCCSFSGSVKAIDLGTGQILWSTSMTPPDDPSDPGAYTGNAVWGSTPVVDAGRKALYIATGNNYTAPDAVESCEANRTSPEQECPMDPRNLFDAVVALDLDSGAVKWARMLEGYDAWTVACAPAGFVDPEAPAMLHPNCPEEPGPDYDFGQGPMLFTVNTSAGSRELLGAGQKSGIFWALDPDTGELVWQQVTGPGGVTGGMLWGSATDGQRVYVANANSNHSLYTLISGGSTYGGAWSALDAATGAILWQTADPDMAIDTGAVTSANGVVYAGSISGMMYAMDAASGQILWRYASGGSVAAGAAVVDGMVYWGSGYRTGTPNNKLYAFTLTP